MFLEAITVLHNECDYLNILELSCVKRRVCHLNVSSTVMLEHSGKTCTSVYIFSLQQACTA